MNDDLISRKAVLDEIDNWISLDAYYRPYSKHENIPVDEIKYRVMNVPSAKLERKGKWGNAGFMLAKCSECGAQVAELEYDNFCPNCGADMREDAVQE